MHVAGCTEGHQDRAAAFGAGRKDARRVDQAIAGDIVAVAKTEDLHTGTSLGEVELPPIKFPTPMVGLAVAPKARGDETKLSGALHKITEEDRTVHLEHDQETKEMVLTGMSELHLQLLRERLKRRDKVEVETHEPKIPYRETIQANAEGSYRHKKQSGGSGQFGEVHIRMYPFPEGTKPEEFATKERFPHLKNTHYHEKNNFLWVDTVVGGTIPGNFHAGDRKGLFGKDQRPASWPATRCKTSASKCISARTTRSTPTKRRSASPAGRRLPTCSAKRGRACWSRS